MTNFQVINRIVESELEPTNRYDLWLKKISGRYQLLYFTSGKWTNLLAGGTSGDYTLPIASDIILGGVMVGDNIIMTDGTISVAAPYRHPIHHSPDIIAQDSDNRFVTDS